MLIHKQKHEKKTILLKFDNPMHTAEWIFVVNQGSECNNTNEAVPMAVHRGAPAPRTTIKCRLIRSSVFPSHTFLKFTLERLMHFCSLFI